MGAAINYLILIFITLDISPIVILKTDDGHSRSPYSLCHYGSSASAVKTTAKIPFITRAAAMAPAAMAPVKTPATKAPVLIHTNAPTIAD